MGSKVHGWAHQIGWYLNNCLRSRDGETLFRVIETHAERLASQISDEDDPDDKVDDVKEPNADDRAAERLSAKRRLSLGRRVRELKAFLRTFRERPPSESGIEENIGYVSEEFGLDDLDEEILLLVFRYNGSLILEGLCDTILGETEVVERTLAALLGTTEEAVRERMAIDAPLSAHGLIVTDRGGHGLCGQDGLLKMSQALAKAMRRTHDDRQALISSLHGVLLTPDLEWSDYEQLGPAAVLARDALVGWRVEGGPALNMLLIGPTGTGKTEFAKTLAHAAGYRIWSVGEAEEGGQEPNRTQRIAALRLAYSVLRNRRDCMLLVDEATDVLLSAAAFGSRKGEHSKLFLNATQTTNPVPVLWACNDSAGIDQATLRRMTHVVEMKVPDRHARRKIWARVLDREGLALPEDAVVRLADRWNAAPALAANASRMARLANGGEAEIEVGLASAMRAVGAFPNPPTREGGKFDPDLVACSEDLAALADRVGAPNGPRSVRILLYGVSGSGKSEYARHLAKRTGLEVDYHHAAELGSHLVNESERLIREAFASARRRKAVMIIDEVESLLFERAGATHSWEVGPVNAMLTCMEDHDFPFMATSNLIPQIDQASLRRFNVKLHFKALDQRRARLAFRRILGVEAPRQLPDGLTPGDIVPLLDKIGLFGPQMPERLVAWLEEEIDIRRGSGTVRPVGFGRGDRSADAIPST